MPFANEPYENEPFPPPEQIEAMGEWCRQHHGAVAAIARLVVQRDGKVGVNHSAVSRTFAGLERNRSVVKAFRLYAGDRFKYKRTRKK